MHSNPAEIGERIKAARKAARLSQTELAQRLDKTMRTVQKYESGEIEPSIAMINAIAKILNISPADLIGYQKPEIQLDSLCAVSYTHLDVYKRQDHGDNNVLIFIRGISTTERVGNRPD